MDNAFVALFEIWERATDLEIRICEEAGIPDGRTIIDGVRQRHQVSSKSYVKLLEESLNDLKALHGASAMR